MTQNIVEVQNTPSITTAEFVKLTIFNDFNDPTDTTTHTFSSAYKPEVIDGVTYLPLGGLLQVGAQNRDLEVTAGDTLISLSGISGNNIVIVAGTKIRGSEIEVSRGFYDGNMVLGNVYPRFTGIITGYGIQEDREGQKDDFTVAVAASSYKTILENRVAGRKTNSSSWKFFNPTDTSMDRVSSIAGVQFDFGSGVTASGTAQPAPKKPRGFFRRLFSDIRTKENIVPVCDTSCGLTLYQYNYKPEFIDNKLAYAGTHLGFMAQDVQDVVPEAVSVYKDSYLCIDYALLRDRLLS